MTEARHGLYCNIVTVPTTQGAGRAWGAGLGVRRRRRGRPDRRGAHGRAGPGGAGARGAQGVRQSGVRAGAEHRRQARERVRSGSTGRAGRAGSCAAGRGRRAGCALDALGLFSVRFDSVLFLSQFLDIVSEPSS